MYERKGGRAASGRPLVTSPAVQGRSRGRRISPQRKARRTLSGKSGFQRAGGSPQMSAPGCGRKGGRRPPSARTAGSPTLSQSLMNSRTSPMNTPPNQGNLKRGFLSLSHGGGAPSRGERAAWCQLQGLGYYGQVQHGAYSKVLDILNQINETRGESASSQTSPVVENHLSSFQLAIDRVKSERIQTV